MHADIDVQDVCCAKWTKRNAARSPHDDPEVGPHNEPEDKDMFHEGPHDDSNPAHVSMKMKQPSNFSSSQSAPSITAYPDSGSPAWTSVVLSQMAVATPTTPDEWEAIKQMLKAAEEDQPSDMSGPPPVPTHSMTPEQLEDVSKLEPQLGPVFNKPVPAPEATLNPSADAPAVAGRAECVHKQPCKPECAKQLRYLENCSCNFLNCNGGHDHQEFKEAYVSARWQLRIVL